ncbi:Hypothetical_protein [Hexamita inflata]|uniref:Hypothetical_protein n=1 Tax=Hexamita inflata TaxID=28002 RepID=A0AA86R750_9EUKA|nr:Hypothetical protein HINF_LOCUS720 [Hexamita inflata]CAI9924621.1 Hypothetical protein HINF_LOCUS12266 [Hexamita inflata]CAI9967264.1 Hypothetical protein HINF_LOCUS54909 [Hexamita inflata]
MTATIYNAIPFTNNSGKSITEHVSQITGFDQSLLQQYELVELNDNTQIQPNDELVIVDTSNDNILTFEQIATQLELLDNSDLIEDLEAKCLSIKSRIELLSNQLKETLMTQKDNISSIAQQIDSFQKTQRKPNTQEQQTLNKIMKSEITFIEDKIKKRNDDIQKIMKQ